MKSEIWNVAEILEATKGQIFAEEKMDDAIFRIEIDSRKIQKGDLFLCLKGSQANGHDFAINAIKSGASFCLVDEFLEKFETYKNRIIKVKNVKQALIDMAIYRRQHLENARIIAVTGSVGKTSCKEMIAAMLREFGETHLSVGNFNNELGLPISLASTPVNCEYAVFELGMSGVGEISFLTNLVKPNLAIITIVAAVHLEFFDDISGIARAKSEIFEGLVGEKIALIPGQHEFMAIFKEKLEKLNVENFHVFGQGEDVEFRMIENHLTEKIKNASKFQFNQEIVECDLNFLGEHGSYNCLIALSVAQSFGLDLQIAAQAISKVEPGKGRGKISQFIFDSKKITLIDESYNASPKSVKAALKNLSEIGRQQKSGRIIAVLGDMLELGEEAILYHREILQYAAQLQIGKVFAVGELMREAALAEKNIMKFENVTKLCERAQELFQDGDIILLKGSNSLGLKEIVSFFEKCEAKNVC